MVPAEVDPWDINEPIQGKKPDGEVAPWSKNQPQQGPSGTSVTHSTGEDMNLPNTDDVGNHGFGDKFIHYTPGKNR
jgi:hypothetical protein